jgi:uncharacterized membrane protein YfcA
MAVGLLMIASGFAAGVFGSLLGLGGGILIVPLLTLGFGVPLREAVGVSLISVIVTSSASASVYLERHVANLRLGMTLELFTATGALVGGLVAFLVSERVLAGLFTALLVYTAVTMGRRREPAATTASNGAPTEGAGLVADGASVGVDPQPSVAGVSQPPPYVVRHLGAGIAGSLFAGLVSALLGIGGGIVKVPVMHVVMGVPLKVATATSNLMIGITASASAIIYLIRGGIDPYVAGPVAVGVFLGASVGSRTAHRVDARVLRLLFVAVLLFTAWQMAGQALR